ncbi:MAG TPA: DUF3231 family protein [Lentibacillus sp.]|uniref:DUF3231 family protein n=1 Tax=Lentibacillus sp. TaxID=1925746 RepID=UPI002B4AE20F|nr:DUF3231 family protein [Lentibacillus sp.]HLR61360.1 DUF3231 family protein [Lentibacillus sp.]
MGEANYQPLTASEMGALWTTYISNSMLCKVFSYGLGYVQDQDVRTHVQTAYDQASRVLDTLQGIFAKENFPVPVGFTEHDVNIAAKPLFDDTFFLTYVNMMGKLGTPQYARFLALSTREDVRTFFSNCLTDSSAQYNQTTEAMLSKGILIRPPYISVPQKVDFVNNKHYMDGSALFTDKRTLNAVEISHLHRNTEANVLGFMVCVGFGQSAESQNVRNYMQRGKDMAKKHIKIFANRLLESDIQAPMSWDESAKDSTDPPFSDKLMMYHMSTLTAASIESYGLAVAQGLRGDLSLTYTRLAAEVAQFAKDGADIMIKNGWMEEPPQADDRDKLIKRKNPE